MKQYCCVAQILRTFAVASQLNKVAKTHICGFYIYLERFEQKEEISFGMLGVNLTLVAFNLCQNDKCLGFCSCSVQGICVEGK